MQIKRGRTMDQLVKKRRDSSRLAVERSTAVALKAVAPAISAANARLARCRAVASLSKPGYVQAVLIECHALRADISSARKQLEQIVLTLPTGQAGSSRVRDTRLALDRLGIAIDGLLETVAAGAAPGDNASGPALASLREGNGERDRQSGAAP